MLGTADEIGRDHGDIDPRRLGRVILAAVLMAMAVGAGIWLTSSGDRPIADTSIVNVPRPRHDHVAPAPHPPNVAPAPRPPNVAPAEQVPSVPGPASDPAPPVVIPAPVAPHPVNIPAPVGPDGGPANPLAPLVDSGRPSG
ncbi:hypothetical protein ACFXG4_05390 [Nocardia sp. NPDC059246]|uniref:hypothetical protein n=1 Tax=unclassified Nocardia TaxID=2637762 RepID=UPI00369388F9